VVILGTIIMDSLCRFRHFINMKEYIVSGFSWEKSGGTTVHHFSIDEAMSEATALEAANYFVSGYRNVEINKPPAQTGTVTMTYECEGNEGVYSVEEESGVYDGGGYEIGDYTAAGIVTKPICGNFENGATITFDNDASFELSSAASMGDVEIYGTLSNADLDADTKAVPVGVYKVNDDDSLELIA
jgi:hypothetical protein